MKPLTDKQVREIIANQVAAFNTAIQTLREDANYVRARMRRLEENFEAIKKGVKDLETFRHNEKANRKAKDSDWV
jgi:phage shock protein A